MAGHKDERWKWTKDLILIFAIRLIDLGDLRILCPVASAPRKSNQLSLTPAQQEIKFMGPIEGEKVRFRLNFRSINQLFTICFIFVSTANVQCIHKKVCEKV